MNKTAINTRSYSLDFFRGIAALGIIIHHTVAYSGVMYCPDWLVPATMLIEVPAFFFLSGITFHYTNQFRKLILRLLKLVYTIVVFFLLYQVFISCYDYIVHGQSTTLTGFFQGWIRSSLFRGENHYHFSAVNASFWFMPLYIKIMLTFGFFLVLVQKTDFLESKRIYIIPPVILIVFTTFIYLQNGNQIPFIQIQVLFYGLFFLIGSLLYRFSIKRFYALVILLILNLTLLYSAVSFYEGSVLNMLSYKFPPHVIFLFFSLFFPLILLYARKYNISAKNPITIAGNNAIYFFLAQGFGTTLTTTAASFLNLHWAFKLSLSILLNILLTSAIAFFLKKLIGLFMIPYQMIIKRLLP